MEVPKKLKIQLLNNLAIPLLGIYLKQMKTVTQKASVPLCLLYHY